MHCYVLSDEPGYFVGLVRLQSGHSLLEQVAAFELQVESGAFAGSHFPSRYHFAKWHCR